MIELKEVLHLGMPEEVHLALLKQIPHPMTNLGLVQLVKRGEHGGVLGMRHLTHRIVGGHCQSEGTNRKKPMKNKFTKETKQLLP